MRGNQNICNEKDDGRKKKRHIFPLFSLQLISTLKMTQKPSAEWLANLKYRKEVLLNTLKQKYINFLTFTRKVKDFDVIKTIFRLRYRFQVAIISFYYYFGFIWLCILVCIDTRE